jgi:glycerol-3-phosphate dehydrogenase (NAD+)
VVREVVKEGADWWISHHDELTDALPRAKVAMIGSGAWACAAMQMVSLNARTKPLFQEQVDMWVYEEDFQGGKLTDKMNELKENPKYLPGVKYGDNVVANPSLEETVRDADLLILCAPHQFIHHICKQLQLMVKPTAMAISLVKGMHVGPDGPQLISAMIRRMLNMETGVLMGANIATEVSPGGLCEGTIGAHDLEHGTIFKELFDTPFFSVNVIHDTEGAELAGTLKNIVALAAGFCDGCDMGHNAKAAILREGLTEMRMFAKTMFPTVRDDTFYESCGIADLIATCCGGRNHRVAEVYARNGGRKSFDELEKELLAGQKLQGVLTSNEVQVVLRDRGWERDYPLFTAVNAISRNLFAPMDIARFRKIVLSPKIERVDQDEVNPVASRLELAMHGHLKL